MARETVGGPLYSLLGAGGRSFVAVSGDWMRQQKSSMTKPILEWPLNLHGGELGKLHGESEKHCGILRNIPPPPVLFLEDSRCLSVLKGNNTNRGAVSLSVCCILNLINLTASANLLNCLLSLRWNLLVKKLHQCHEDKQIYKWLLVRLVLSLFNTWIKTTKYQRK